MSENNSQKTGGLNAIINDERYRSVFYQVIVFGLFIWAVFSLLLPMTCFLLAVGFLTTLERERFLSRIIILPNWWLKMRFQLTTLMVFLLIIMGFNV